MQLGEKLSRLRKSKGISQELLAENSHISLRTIQRIEAGSAMPRPHTIKTLAESLGVPIEQLNTAEIISVDSTPVTIAKLKLINFSVLTGLIIPFSNIFFTVLLWRKSRTVAGVNEAGKKIISFQLMWTLATSLLVFLVPVIQYSIVQSYVIGHFPPTVVLVYITLLVLNLLFTIRTAIQLQKGEFAIYSFIPSLF